MSVIDALAREVGSVGKALRRLKEPEWNAATRCPPMNVKDLVAHMARGGTRILDMTADGPVGSEPEKDGVTYFQYDVARVSNEVVERAQSITEGKTTVEMIEIWDEWWSKGLRAARTALVEGDGVYPGIFGLIRMSEYLRTRVVEVVVHHMDLDDALGHDLHPDPEALEICGDVLRGLLGTDLRATGMDDVRFALTGTGRAPLTADEENYLGPLAARFPMLS